MQLKVVAVYWQIVSVALSTCFQLVSLHQHQSHQIHRHKHIRLTADRCCFSARYRTWQRPRGRLWFSCDSIPSPVVSCHSHASFGCHGMPASIESSRPASHCLPPVRVHLKYETIRWVRVIPAIHAWLDRLPCQAFVWRPWCPFGTVSPDGLTAVHGRLWMGTSYRRQLLDIKQTRYPANGSSPNASIQSFDSPFFSHLLTLHRLKRLTFTYIFVDPEAHF